MNEFNESMTVEQMLKFFEDTCHEGFNLMSEEWGENQHKWRAYTCSGDSGYQDSIKQALIKLYEMRGFNC